MSPRRSAALLSILLLLAGPAIAQAPATISDAIQDMLLARAGDVQPPLEQQVLSFYLTREFAPVWSNRDEAVLVRDVLAHAEDQGLRPVDYAVHGEAGSAAFDLALTTALFRYAHDVRLGRLKPSLYKDAQLPPQSFDPGRPLTQALERHRLRAFLDSLPPREAHYQRLVAALALYRAVAAAGGWPQLADSRMLAYRLALEDPELMPQQLSEEAVRAALMRYQQRNGITADGKLGAETLRSLNVPVTMRVRQIVANLERWRWMPPELERRRVEVNVPDQSLDLMDGNDVVLHSKVIIGKKSTPTPILRMAAFSVIVNPSWDIPDDIAARQFLPRLRRDANYMAKSNMSFVDAPPGAEVNWRKVSASKMPFQLRQPPGPDNALGRLMLDSPSDFDVYMHDTPSKALFQKPVREFSNGCIRVEQIQRLAGLALGDDAMLDEALQSPETQTLTLARPLPVYLLYWTAIAGEDGTTGFRPDRYGRDALLLAKLDSQ